MRKPRISPIESDYKIAWLDLPLVTASLVFGNVRHHAILLVGTRSLSGGASKRERERKRL